MPTPSSPSVRLLIVDYLDSYSYNIPAFLHEARHNVTSLSVDIKSFDTLSTSSVASIVSYYHGIVLSAGPGTVELEEDLGKFTPALLSAASSIPIYGICLGFQAICRHFGATIRRLAYPHHGLISDLEDCEGNLLGRRATRYHSLEVGINKQCEEHLEVLAWAKNYGDPNLNSRCVMEIKHRKLPYWGVQYHPESIYSHGCEGTVQEFLHAAQKKSVFAQDYANDTKLSESVDKLEPPDTRSVLWKCVEADTDLLNILSLMQPMHEYVLLDSSSKGQWDILAAAKTSYLFRYSVRRRHMLFKATQDTLGEKISAGETINIDRSASLEEAWSFLGDFSSSQKFENGPPDVPFWGGFIGYFGYELGLDGLGIEAYKSDTNNIPEYGDIQLLWSTDTLIYHKPTKLLYAISLNGNSQWIDSILKLTPICQQSSARTSIAADIHGYTIDHPHQDDYIKRIKVSQDEIRAGNSYEICLTATSKTRNIGSVPFPLNKEPSLMDRFHTLRKKTPAAFMSLMSLGGVEVLSASPEEFLSFESQNGIARMKPIKGTLPKTEVSGPISLHAAQERLHQPKVIAENLMIVDLVRHDLSKVSSHVSCPDLMRVEDIGPMYQLISTVRAEVKNKSAWDLIRHSLPPGSMTGAPKRRSCEILQRLEDDYRGLYSGITGFIDVRGNCKTSVNIRNAVRYPTENYWRIGAGGAITSLSDPVDEWDERQLKASSICRSLLPQFAVLETIRWDPDALQLVYWDDHVTRLLRALKYFGFVIPFVNAAGGVAQDSTITSQDASLGGEYTHTDNIVANGSKSSSPRYDEPDGRHSKAHKHDQTAFSRRLSNWILCQPQVWQQCQSELRLSLTIDSSGHPSLTSLPISTERSVERVKVRLDSVATLAHDLEPFITHKTTYRNHYNSARERSGVLGREEVLLFRPAQETVAEKSRNLLDVVDGTGSDLLTEGSYTNVACWEPKRSKWCTPGTGCLPGIMREKLLHSEEIIIGDVRRDQIGPGEIVKLFNSVRGVFEGIVTA